MPEIWKTEKAKQDLIELASYLYAVEPDSDVSERFLRATEEALTKIAQMPGIGVSVDTNQPRLAGLKRWPVPGFRNHLIFYRPTEAGVEVVRVLHGARDLASVFEEENE